MLRANQTVLIYSGEEGGMVFNATFNNISVIPGKSYSTSHVCTLKNI
jgi:hypothetical protein